ncbi:MAG: hypothetical protein HY918_02095 [Candidatus Doudnabacteria bacterium]|nr:hypothetical protein [Candidatus Doudnabacteria bacterium]
MLKKLKINNKFYGKDIQGNIRALKAWLSKLAFTGLVALFIIGPVLYFTKPALAANCTTSTIGTDQHTICDGLSVSFTDSVGGSITEAHLGDTIYVKLTSPSSVAGQPQFYVGLCSGLNDFTNCATASGKIASVNGSVNQSSATIAVSLGSGGKLNSAQKYSIGGLMQLATINSGGTFSTVTYKDTVGVATLTVLPAQNTGVATLKAVESSRTYDSTITSAYTSGSVNLNMAATYSNGGTTKTLSSYTYDCGNNSGVQTSSAGSTMSFKCTYPSTSTSSPKTYQVTVVGSLSDGTKTQPGVTSITITGNEAGQSPGQAAAQNTNKSTPGIAAIINEILGTLIGLVQEFVYAVFFYLIAPLIQAMLSIHVYTDTFAAVIYPGWEVVRNICNIFFVIALIIIAMATLFRVDSYQFRSLLVQLILAALMVNFSLVIAQAILGLADTIQAQFLPSNVEVIRSLAKDLMVNTYRDIYYQNPFGDSSFSGIVKPLFFLALALGSFTVFAAIAAFLVIRIVALWVLLLISPIAYAAGALPATASYRKTWWDYFIKYAFFTPIMAFFLNLTAVIANTYKTNPVLQSINDGTLTQNLGGSDIAGFVFKVASNILLLIFLFASLMVAEKFGVMGAGAVTGIAKKGIFAPFGAIDAGAKTGASMFGRAYARYTTGKAKEAEAGDRNKTAFMWKAAGLLNPKVAKKAWEERQHDKELESYSEAMGLARDTLNRYMPTEWNNSHGKFNLGQKTYYGKIGHENMIAHKRSEWEKANLTMPEKVAAFEGAHHKEEVEALMYIMTDGRHEDDWMMEVKKAELPEIKAQIKKNLMAQGKSEAEAEKLAQDRADVYFDKVEYGDLLYEKLVHGGASHEDAVRAISHLQEYAEGQSKGRNYGMTVEDPDGAVRLASDQSMYKQMDNKQMLNSLNDLGIFESTKDADGNVTELKFVMKDKETGSVLGTETIKNYSDFESAKARTKEKYGNYYDHAYKIADLEYAVTGARSWRYDGRTRQNRGTVENHMKGRERGEVAVLTGKRGAIGSTSYGNRATVELTDLSTTVIGKLRNLQPRALEEIGVKKDAQGNSYIDYKQFAIKWAENSKLVRQYITQAGLGDEEKQKICDEINSKYKGTAGITLDMKKEDLAVPKV